MHRHAGVVIKEATAAVAELHEIDLAELTDGELTEDVLEVVRLTNAAEALVSKMTREIDRRGAIQSQGQATSVTTWLSWQGRMTKRRAGRMLRNGRSMADMPLVAIAYSEGRISADHVGRLSDAQCLNPSAFARDEAELVHQAEQFLFRLFCGVVSEWELRNAEDAVEERERKRMERRRAYCSRNAFGFTMGAEFDEIGGEVFAAEWQRLVDQLYERDRAEARARGDEYDLGRSTTQRRLDALVEMAMRSASMPPDARAPRPLFTVVVGVPALDRACRLASGAVVTPGQLAKWLGDADIERIVFDGPSRVIDVGVRQRFFRGALRRAIEVRDGFCFHDSCDEPAPRCQVDHIEPYESGGFTTQENGRLACGFHNRHRHRGPPSAA